jgi:hypothetical protein
LTAIEINKGNFQKPCEQMYSILLDKGVKKF